MPFWKCFDFKSSITYYSKLVGTYLKIRAPNTWRPVVAVRVLIEVVGTIRFYVVIVECHTNIWSTPKE